MYRKLTPRDGDWWAIRLLLLRVAVSNPARFWDAWRHVRRNPQTPEQRMEYLREQFPHPTRRSRTF